MKKIIFTVFTLLFLLALPMLVWHFQETEPLAVAIIDKTVPTENYREHHGLTWLLNYSGYTKDGGSAYKEDSDFYGFLPNEEEKDYSIRQVPDTLEGSDLIYVADTYGVYEEDLSWNSSTGDAPSLIYGGMDMAEWETVKRQVTNGGSDLVVEFNSFSSPTDSPVREDMTEFLGVSWTGWSGRYFKELAGSDEEVPAWVISRYEDDNSTWDFQGSGFVLVNDKEERIVVLSEQRNEVGPDGIRMQFSGQGAERFGLSSSPAFQYWFDISEAKADESVIAGYDWDLTSAGSKILQDNGIPEAFPAIVRQQKDNADAYYFAGDFVDISKVPSFYQYAGYSKIMSWLSLAQPESETSFYWQTYAPLMDKILGDAKNQPQQLAHETIQAEQDGINYPSRINGQEFEVFQDGEWRPMTIKGVNMGMAKPGTFPGEAAISQSEYERWFKQIADMNANVLRIYTLHPPGFYEALKRHNETAEEPLYLLQGVWIDEEPLAEKLDAFDPEITERFQGEIRMLADVIHGKAEVGPEPGHASGNYTADISPYVIGWVIGIEWDPVMVEEMDRLYPDLGDFSGTHIYTENANPMEHWLAQQLDGLAKYEMETYQSMRPLSFTNWVTTDNLEHPADVGDIEDIATVDPNHIKAKENLSETGMFASYHVYPYYPDFLNLEEKYTEFIDHRGERNNYAGYLKDLKDSHELPILIAEFGVPASRGKTHDNPFGWNQGFISEKQHGDIAQHLYEDIIETNMLGGIVFTWQDEWFKRTWNTMDYDNADRRPFWSNAQTNEQQFGLLAFDRHKVKVDGEDDWDSGTALYKDDKGKIKSLAADHDERYLYIKTTFNEDAKEWLGKDTFNLYFSIREDGGISFNPAPGETAKADFQLAIKSKESARLLVAGDYDTFYYDYAVKQKFIPQSKKDITEEFHPIRLALNKEITRPDTGEVIPFSSYETGVLQYGIANPDMAQYDSLNDWFYSEDTGVLEIRIPWMLLNAKDPSNKEFIGDLQKDGIEASMKIDGIGISAVLADSENTIIDSTGLGKQSFYTWENWALPESEERLKQSYFILQDYFGGIK
ncbi:hypothetical protein HNQ44_000659 [Planomicrobium koreense]|uniref:Family 2 glycosyl transferase n=1 Tax=Planococcus koreensis TaxID=112331 RepID=A0A7W8CS79_9BACL|nr:hypothetical protein [Planococcus koreensis]MBB5179237.1 hypothetical protein [Planococcus koreensis]